MTEIGNIIRSRREELGLTLAEVSEKTKISMIHLVAIENGDMDHFKHDMVFLRFYLKTISVALDLDFKTIAHQFNLSKDDYTNTISLKKIKENEASEANVVKNRQLSDSKYIYQNIKKRRVDVSFITLLIAIVVIVIGLVFVFFNSVLPLLSREPELIYQPIDEIPSEITPEPQPEPEPETNPEPTIIVVAKTGLTAYSITDWVEGKQVKFVVSFFSNSMMKVYIDDVLTNNPSARIYNYGETMEIIVEAAANRKVSISFGYIKRNTIKVDGIDAVIDPTIANLPRSYRIEFTFAGGS